MQQTMLVDKKYDRVARLTTLLTIGYKQYPSRDGLPSNEAMWLLPLHNKDLQGYYNTITMIFSYSEKKCIQLNQDKYIYNRMNDNA